MDYNTSEECTEDGQETAEIDAQSVYRALEQIRDGRHKRGVRYSVAEILTFLASASDLLRLQREHWAIENRLHHRRDVTLREDHCQIRKGAAPRILAILNSFLLGLLDFCGGTNVPQRMRAFDAQPSLAVRLLLGSLLTFT